MDEARLIEFLEGLTPADFGRVTLRLPGVAGQLPTSAPHFARVEALVIFIRSVAGLRATGGQGMALVAQVVESLFPRTSFVATAENPPQAQPVALPAAQPVKLTGAIRDQWAVACTHAFSRDAFELEILDYIDQYQRYQSFMPNANFDLYLRRIFLDAEQKSWLSKLIERISVQRAGDEVIQGLAALFER